MKPSKILSGLFAGNLVLVFLLTSAHAVQFTGCLETGSPPPGSGGTLDIRVSAGTDDAEEQTSGSVKLTSSDLELVFEGSRKQTVGMRFNGVNIPNGAIITNAYVQLQVDERDSEVTNLNVQGEKTANAPTFTSANENISLRPLTTASVAWSPPAWDTVGEAGPDQQTPDITPIIQEIVNQGLWVSGNSLAIIMNGTGERTAESFNGKASAAPLLHIEFLSNGSNGTIARIAIGATPTDPCKNNETQITWNSEGPQGPAGPAGTDGLNGLDGLPGADGAQGPPGAAGPTFILKDSNGQQVGTVLSISSQHRVLTLLKVIFAGEERKFIISVQKPTIDPTTGSIYFRDPNCTGDAFANPIYGGFEPAFELPLIDGIGNTRPMYLFSNNVLNPEFVKSVSRFNGCVGVYESTNTIPPSACFASQPGAAAPCTGPQGFTIGSLIPITLIDPDLNATFPPPFTLEAQ